jgi:hypothetical protein
MVSGSGDTGGTTTVGSVGAVGTSVVVVVEVVVVVVVVVTVVIVLSDASYPDPEKLFVFSAVAPNVFPLAMENEFALTPLYTEEPLFQLFAN